MANILSFSQLNKYKFCQESWRLHYKDKIRPTAIFSPLIFGSAIGKTFEYILIAKRDNIPTSGVHDILTFEEFFDEHWTRAEVNGEMTILKDNTNIVYLKSDLDEELASTPWESLRVKAHLMIDAFVTQFLPLVTKVYSTEEKAELSSGEDSNIMYADAVVEIEGYDKPIIIDFKTSARKYEHNSVRESVQLGQYLYSLGDKYNTDLAGYVVFLKNINKNRRKICKECGFDGSGARFKICNNQLPKIIPAKRHPISPSSEDTREMIKAERCNGEWNETIHPTCSFQLIIDKIPIEFQEEVIDEIGTINDKINTGIIEKNLEGCLDDGFRRRCIYYDLCHNQSMNGLIKLEKKNA